MNDANLLALVFYVAAAWWLLSGLYRVAHFDFSAAVAMLMASIIAFNAGYERWGKSPEVVRVDPVKPPQSR